MEFNAGLFRSTQALFVPPGAQCDVYFILVFDLHVCWNCEENRMFIIWWQHGTQWTPSIQDCQPKLASEILSPIHTINCVLIPILSCQPSCNFVELEMFNIIYRIFRVQRNTSKQLSARNAFYIRDTVKTGFFYLLQ